MNENHFEMNIYSKYEAKVLDISDVGHSLLGP